MSAPTDNETWIIERGDAIIQKKAHSGLGSLDAWEKLVYCLWVADYGMRNAGDLNAARDVYPGFLAEGRRTAEALALPLTRQLFSMSQRDLQRVYLDRFEALCEEIRNAEPGAAPNGGLAMPPPIPRNSG